MPNGVQPIAGVPTSIAAVVGFFSRGSMNQPWRLLSAAEFDSEYGGLRADSLTSYAIRQFFLNGGQQAWVVRTASGTPRRASIEMQDQAGTPVFTAAAVNEGEWGNNLRVDVDYGTTDPASMFNLTVSEVVGGRILDTESFRDLTVTPGAPRYAVDVIAAGSRLIRLTPIGTPITRPAPTGISQQNVQQYVLGSQATTGRQGRGEAGDDGRLPGARELIDALPAFDGIDLINILCLPDTDRLGDIDAAEVAASAAAYAARRRAFYILDPPNLDVVRNRILNIKAWLEGSATLRHQNAAAYFPRPMLADPLNESQLRAVPASGTVAGLYARTDAERGVWKAPAGREAVLRGVQQLEYVMTDAENGVLNPLGMNALRTFPTIGSVCWGSRTLAGAEVLASEWKYVPVRRLALFLEESIDRGTRFALFEPNDEPLWAQIRLSVGAFMLGLFRQGAFQGTTPRDTYFVKCDRGTTTQQDIARGTVNVVVGFAPLKPAEFVIITIRQLAGQTQE